MESRSITNTSYDLSIREGAFQCRWRPERFTIGRKEDGIFVYGRDYPELLNAAAEGLHTSFAETFDPRSPKFRRVISAKLRQEEVYLGLRFSPDIESAIASGAIAALSDVAPETYLRRLTDRFPDLRPVIQIIRESIEVARSFLVRHDGKMTLISVDALEGTPFLLALANVVNTDKAGRWVIFGPERYRTIFNFKPVPRPLIATNDVLALYEQATNTSPANAVEKFATWQGARLGPAATAGVTVTEANDFVTYAQSTDPALELATQLVPPPIAAPLSVGVVGGRLSVVQPLAATLSEEEAVRASCIHLINIIGDINAAGYLSNWSPGALRKFARIESHLHNIDGDQPISVSTVTSLGLDSEALKEIFKTTKDELGEAVVNEFGPFFLHLDLLLAQFPSWAQFLVNAERMNWGHGVSTSYVEAIEAVFSAVAEAPRAAVDAGVGEFANEALKEDVSNPINVVGGSLSVRNILSVASRYFLTIRDRALKAGGHILSEQVSELAKSALHNVFAGLGEAMLALAQGNPRLFGWLEVAVRIIGWDKKVG
jgi:hypothetical protein